MDIIREVESAKVGFKGGGHEFLVYGADEVKMVYSKLVFLSYFDGRKGDLHMAV